MVQFHRSPGWLWAYCTAVGCPHHAPLVIRWGGDTSSDRVRARPARDAPPQGMSDEEFYRRQAARKASGKPMTEAEKR